MVSRMATVLLVAFVAHASAAANIALEKHLEVSTHGEIRSHGVHSSKRMMRKESLSSGLELVDEIEDTHLGRLLVETRQVMPKLAGKPSLLEGPGNMRSVEDAFNESISMMLEYDKSISFDCSVTHGRRMLKNLLESRFEHHICAGNNVSITCHERVPFDVSRYMCSLNNVMLSGEGTSAPGCTKNAYESFMPSAGVTEHNIFGKTTRLKDLNTENMKLECRNTIPGKALVQVAADVQNFYEWYGDWITLWETMAALGWHPKDVDLYLVGKITETNSTKYTRPFDEAWVRMFKTRLHVGSMDELFGSIHGGTCFEQIVTVPQGSLSTISFHGGRGGSIACPSPLVMSSAMYLQALFPLPNATSDGMKHITVLQRKPGMRAWDNDIMVIRDIQDVAPKGWTVTAYRPEDLPTFEAQLMVVRNTQIWVGIHGAGMMHVLFLPPSARIVEVFCGDRPRMNHHFRNLETMGEPAVGAHLFHYYFESDTGRCKIDPKVMQKAIEAYDAGTAVESPKVKADV